MGKQAMKQIMEQQEAQLKQNPLLMRGAAVQDMASENYNSAYERWEYLAKNYNDNTSWLYMGYMNELGMGTTKSYSYAKTCYKNGAELGNSNCDIELRRINQGNYLDESKKIVLRQYFQNIVSMSNQSIGSRLYLGNSPLSNSINSNRSTASDSYTCPTCHGTGRCTMCAGRGEYWTNGRHYDCSMCHGGGSCYGCHGSGRIR